MLIRSFAGRTTIMAIVNNRIPTEPNRMLITPEDGSAPFYATVTYADEPTDPGTKINKALFDQVQFFLTQTEEVPPLTNFNLVHSGENANANDFTAVAADGNTVVAFSKNICAYSTDGGKNWTESTLPSSIATDKVWSGALIADGVWLAWSEEGQICSTSNSGSSWTVFNLSSASTEVYGVAYGDGRFVATGLDGRVAVSSNGTTWTRSQPLVTTGDYTVCYGNGVFVAGVVAGNSGASWYYSSDGTSWTAATNKPINRASAILFNGEKFFAIAVYTTTAVENDSNLQVYTSANGQSWTELTNDTVWNGRSANEVIKFENGQFLFFQNRTTEGVSGYWTSTDGENWTWTQLTNSPNTFTDLAYSNDTYFLSGGDSLVYSSNAETETVARYQTQTNENEVVGDVIHFDYGTANAAANGVTLNFDFLPKLLFFMAGEDNFYASIFPAAYAWGGHWNLPSFMSTPINWAGNSIFLPEITEPIVYVAIG